MIASPWWTPHVYADRRPFLVARSRITAAVREWFTARDFVEVETAILQASPGNEAHLHGFATELISPDASKSRVYLHTSPEFAAKKLLAAGEKRPPIGINMRHPPGRRNHPPARLTPTK